VNHDGVFFPAGVYVPPETHPWEAAADIATKAASMGLPIKKPRTAKHSPTLGKEDIRLANDHWIIREYRERIGNNKANVAHFMDQLAEAEKKGRVRYQLRYGNKAAGYFPAVEVADRLDTIEGAEISNQKVEQEDG
jgi:hypothetical protein